jgi:hypothetical protein
LNNFYETVVTLNKFWRWFTADLIDALSPTWFFFLTLSGISRVTILKYTLILPPTIHKKYRKQNKQPKRKLVRQINIQYTYIVGTSFRNRQNSEPSASFSGLFRSEYKWILYWTTMYVYCVYPAMSKKKENKSDLNKKDRNKRHSSPFINVVFFVVRVTLVPVSYLSAPSAVT